jgi:hydrogenase maturation protein HypF
MMLEAVCRSPAAGPELPLVEGDDGVFRTDWQPLLGMLANHTIERSHRAELFHGSLARAIAEQATAIGARHHIAQIGLCGGVFQNRVLAEQSIALLEDAGFSVYLPSALPCNDAALSYGQAAEIAARELRQ